MKSAPLGHDREIMAAVLRQLVCDLCGDSVGSQRLRFFCGVPPYGATSGNRQRRQDREIVALMPLLYLSIFYFYFSSKQSCCATFAQKSATIAVLRCLMLRSVGISASSSHGCGSCVAQK